MKVNNHFDKLSIMVRDWFDSNDNVNHYAQESPMGMNDFEVSILKESLYLNHSTSQNPVKVLDIGCGAGRVSMQLAKQGYHVTGIDVSQGLIDQASRLAMENHLTIDYQMVNSSEILCSPFDDECFDSIIAFKLYGYIPGSNQRQLFLNEMYRILKPEGRLIITQSIVPEDYFYEYQDQYYDDMSKELVELEPGDTFPEGKGYVHWFTKQTLYAELVASPLVLERYGNDGGDGLMQLVILKKES